MGGSSKESAQLPPVPHKDFALCGQSSRNCFRRTFVKFRLAPEHGQGRPGDAREKFNHFATPERCRRKITSSACVFIKLVCIQRSCQYMLHRVQILSKGSSQLL